ncbi:hypothetical protein PYCC9005_004987 [Savitreella phatthalungensis]
MTTKIFIKGAPVSWAKMRNCSVKSSRSAVSRSITPSIPKKAAPARRIQWY